MEKGDFMSCFIKCKRTKKNLDVKEFYHKFKKSIMIVTTMLKYDFK